MKGKIEEVFKKKYDEVEVPDDIFNFDEIFEKGDKIKKKRKVYKYVASIIILLLFVTIGITFWLYNTTNNLIRKESIDKEEENTYTSNLPGYAVEIDATNYFESKNDIEDESVYSLKVEEILDYSTESNTKVTYPITKVKAKVENTLVGTDKKEIEFWVLGGVMNVSDLKNSNLYYDESLISNLSDDDYVMVNYSNIDKVVVNNTYIATLYEENNELYVSMSSKYIFREYDTNLNMVKNNNGEYEEVDLSDWEK